MMHVGSAKIKARIHATPTEIILAAMATWTYHTMAKQQDTEGKWKCRCRSLPMHFSETCKCMLGHSTSSYFVGTLGVYIIINTYSFVFLPRTTLWRSKSTATKAKRFIWKHNREGKVGFNVWDELPEASIVQCSFASKIMYAHSIRFN